MKKVIIFICVIVIAITINSCTKRQWYACCDTGHSHWEGRDRYDDGDAGGLKLEIEYHDKNIHGGVQTAGKCFK